MLTIEYVFQLFFPSPPIRHPSEIPLCDSITKPVLQEALKKEINMIVSYHTPIFRPLRAFTLSNPLQATLLRCAQAGISVYTPHSALDSAKGGINDWLATLVPVSPSSTSGGERRNEVAPIVEKDGKTDVGAGRIVRIGKPGVSFVECVRSVKEGLGLDHGECRLHHVESELELMVRLSRNCGALRYS